MITNKAAQMLINELESNKSPRYELRWYTFTGQLMSVRYHSKREAQRMIDAGFPATLHKL
jgi:hypothetical protein